MTRMIELRTQEARLLEELGDVRVQIAKLAAEGSRGSDVSGTKHLRVQERQEREREAMAVLDRVLADVSLVSGLPRGRILERSRMTAPQRHAWWWLAYHAGGVRHADIVRATGYHHTTVMNGIDRALDVPESEAIIQSVAVGDAASAAAELGIAGPVAARVDSRGSEVAA